MADIYARRSILTSPASPIIIQTYPGQSVSVGRDFKNIELSHKLSTLSDRSSILRGISQQFPRVGSMANTVSGMNVLSMTPFSVMSNIDYVTGVWSGTDVENIAQDPRVKAIWKDGVNRHISSYPIAGADYTYSVPQSSGQRMYFTSMDEIRRLVGADVANSQGYSGSGVNATVIDTGGHKSNPMTTRLVKKSAIPGLYTDENGHGEWCVSALGGTRARDTVFTGMNPGKKPVYNEGIAPKSNITEIKSLDLVVGSGTDSWLLRGLSMALSDGADVVSCSWGGSPTTSSQQSDPYYAPMQKLEESGAVVCVASGDSGPTAASCDSPGTLSSVLTVGAINAVTNTFSSQFGRAGDISGFSSRGPAYGHDIKPDTASYGAIIDSAISPILSFSYTHVAHDYQAIAGTSQATPIVAGLVTLMKQLYREKLGKTLTTSEVKAMLSQLGHTKNNNDGWGMLTWDMVEKWVQSQYNTVV